MAEAGRNAARNRPLWSSAGGRLAAVTLLAVGAVVGGAGTARSETMLTSCTGLVGTTVPASAIGLPTTGASVTSATVATLPVPHCQVNGRIAPVDPAAPNINFRVNLPVAWNGKAFQLGGGGFNGSVVTATGTAPSAPPGTPGPLARGYTTMGSDSGHQGGNAAFALNDEALVNFGYAQLKKTKDVAVFLMDAHYGSRPSRVYFAGSSQGGREAVTVAQRFPDDYDGVFSRVPVLNFTALQIAGNRMGTATVAGTGGWMNPAKVALLSNAVFAACDGRDGLVDGIVGNYARCSFQPAQLRCEGGVDTGDTCLSDAQIAAVDTLRSPLRFDYPLANGVTFYPGWGTGHEQASWGAWVMSPAGPPPATQPAGTAPGGAAIINFGAMTVRYFIARDPSFQTYGFDHNDPRWRPRIQEVSSIVDSTDPELSAFRASGGKMIIQEHMGDFAQSPYAGIEYYKAIVATLGKRAADDFVRAYVSPGADHGGGNAPSQVDMVAVLENWVENGIAPGNLVQAQSSPASLARTRPMCQYPAWPRYVGGDANVASSFRCTRTESVDVKPRDDANVVNRKSNGNIPVAILSNALFDAPAQIDAASLTFGATGAEDSLAFCNEQGEDVNGDALLDLVCHFDAKAAAFGAADDAAVLEGRLTSGDALYGTDFVRLVH